MLLFNVCNIFYIIIRQLIFRYYYMRETLKNFNYNIFIVKMFYIKITKYIYIYIYLIASYCYYCLTRVLYKKLLL